MKKFWFILLFIAIGCTRHTDEQSAQGAESSAASGMKEEIFMPSSLMEVGESPHWIYNNVIKLHQTMIDLEPNLVGRTLADFDGTKDHGYELLKHREEMKNPQVYADYQGFDKELLHLMMEFTLSEAEINNLYYYGLTNPETLPGQLLMSWLIMYQPSDFFSAWYSDISYTDEYFWREFFSRYYGSKEFVQHFSYGRGFTDFFTGNDQIARSGSPWLAMMLEIEEDWDLTDINLNQWDYWYDYRMAEGKVVQIRQALLLAQLIDDYHNGNLSSGKLYEQVANFLAYHQIQVGFSKYYDDYVEPNSFARGWVEDPSQHVAVYNELYISKDLLARYQLDDVNTIPGQILAMQFVDYPHWYDWDDYLISNRRVYGSSKFVEQKFKFGKVRENVLEELQILYDVMAETGYQWRGGEGDPRTILDDITFVDPHPLYQQMMRLSRVMPHIDFMSKKLVLDETEYNNYYYVALLYREKIGHPSDYADYRGYDARVVDEMLNSAFSVKGVEELKEQKLTTPNTIAGLVLIGWLLREQPYERFDQWYPDLSLALPLDTFWREVLIRIYGSRTFVEENDWFYHLSGSGWMELVSYIESQPRGYANHLQEYYQPFWYEREFLSNLYEIAEARRLALLRELLESDNITNERVKEALDKVLQYHTEHIGFATDYDDFVLTQENAGYSNNLVEQLRIFRSIENQIYIDGHDYGVSHLYTFGSKEFSYNLAKMEMMVVSAEDPYRSDIGELTLNLRKNLEIYYDLLEELYTAVLEDGYR